MQMFGSLGGVGTGEAAFCIIFRLLVRFEKQTRKKEENSLQSVLLLV